MANERLLGLDRIKELMSQPQFIRNIGVCAHIDML